MTRPWRFSVISLGFSIALFGGCNAITGAGDLSIGQGGAASAAATDGPGPGVTTGTQAGPGSTGPGSTGSTGTGTGTSTTGPGSSSSTGMAMCNPPCGANMYCEQATLTCQCNPGFVMQGGSCQAAPPGDPSTHTQQDVCDHWKNGHMVTEPNPLMASGMACDAGSLKQGAFVDTLARINMFRWFVGLGPTSDDAQLDANAQLCANLESWWDFNMGGSPHQPPPGVKCYTATGAQTAGESNIAWGSGSPAQAIDQFMQDNGNATTLGHRRWILNPPLAPIGIGYWQGGGMYGNAECLRVFGMSGNGPHPSWYSVPNAGFAELTTAGWTWSFHGSLSGIATAKISVLRVDDNMQLAVNVAQLNQGYGEDAIAWTPSGWMAEAGKTYRVTVSGLGGGDVVYDVKPVSCP